MIVAKTFSCKKLPTEDQDSGMANQLGKVYICAKCGSQVIVTKAGAGQLKCDGVPMEQKK